MREKCTQIECTQANRHVLGSLFLRTIASTDSPPRLQPEGESENF